MALNKQIYSIDRVKFRIPSSKSRMAHTLPLRAIQLFCRGLHLFKNSQSGAPWDGAFYCTLDLIVPRKEAFSLLKEYEKHFPGYKISHIEIAKDEIFRTEEDSIKHFDAVLKTTRKKYARRYWAFKAKDKEKLSNEKYHDEAGYWGSRQNQFVVYPRLSKVNGRHCVHSEFRFKGASLIRKKTGISTLDGLIDFEIRTFFYKEEEKCISHENINHKKHGMWIEGRMEWVDKKGKLTARPSRIPLQWISKVFCRANKIKTSADLRSFWKRKNKENDIRKGRKKTVQKKPKTWPSYHRINTFFDSDESDQLNIRKLNENKESSDRFKKWRHYYIDP